MDTDQARATLREQLIAYRNKPYMELRDLIGHLDVFVIGNPGARPWQIEIEVMWDGKPGGDIRVIGGIDDGGWSAFKPMAESFIKGTGDVFVGE
jgi:hypothetical protein